LWKSEGKGISQLYSATAAAEALLCHRQSGRTAYMARYKLAPTANVHSLVSRLIVYTHVITWITTHLPTLDGRKVELAWLAGPQRTFYPQNGNP